MAAEKGLLRWVPAGALIVAEIDPVALRRTPLGKRILGGGRRVAGLGDVESICGVDPLQSLQRLVVAVPQSEQAGFGLFGEGALDAPALLRCAREIATRQGGKTIESKGPHGFRILGSTTPRTAATELAVRPRGPMLLSTKRYVRAALAVGAAAQASMHGDAQHAALRQLVGPAMVRVTAVLSDQQRASLRRQLGRGGRQRSPFLGVLGGALSLQVQDGVRGVAALRCRQAAECAAVAQTINRYLKQFADEGLGRLLGLGELLGQGAPAKAVGATVVLRLRLPVGKARLLLKLMLGQRRLKETQALPLSTRRIQADPATANSAAASGLKTSLRPTRTSASALPAPSASSSSKSEAVAPN